MPPKMSFKPSFSGSARSRKKVVVPAEGEGSDNDAQMADDNSISPTDEGGIIEDEMQLQERLEEERLLKRKSTNDENHTVLPSVSTIVTPHKDLSESEQKKERVNSVIEQPRMDELSLHDESSPPTFESASMDVDGDNYDQDTDATMDTGSNKLPDFADEGDELVKEIPVYLSQRLAKYLYLFQYPVRAAAFTYTRESSPSKARIKPISQLIELEIPLDTNASQYNRERGEELALGMNDKALRTALDEEPDDDEDKELLDKQTLVSSLIPNATNYLAGVLRNDEMHLTPFHGAVQLRPSFKYLDKIDEKHKQANKKVSDEENKELLAKQKVEQDQKAKALQVQVRSATDSEARKASGPNKARLADEESWTKLDYFDIESLESEIIYDRMFASHVDDLECATSVNEYLDMVSSANSLRNVKIETIG
ncbi:DNA-directed RNA polymerase III subunit RPC5 [Lobosporangium transversale]|uniref:Sin-like protein conserved region-domain-containing protein n=1 Tax=Lobosporangium transversale TaxID=64571 RepID=A0A1Y2GBG1_9FUNG|nr:Sin-like protein conserved region-domain-containing protein [Lobosporangium transversale]KAF9918070.1 DNA-directed RNA polymerase III subunit RPC5 [Lobosporangium transversale]ORZ06326.1 Sin-like protein conserved region-domain-containing protein [Lobosporangium transversale]|eukprot:XP_021877489.1 Sin-like protein conserved region-domain-containing protein [Lobosporangium transversale]